jgi:hypothetical protein
MPTGRNHVGATVFKRGLLVTGGRTDGGANLTAVEFFDPDGDGWLKLGNLDVPRSGHAAVKVRAGPVVVFGGEQLSEGDQTIPQVEAFDYFADEWTPLPPMPTPRHGLGGASKGDLVYSLEGGPQPGLAFSSALESLQVP